MKHKKNVLLLGAGGWSREHWIANVIPSFTDELTICGLVDKNKEILNDSGKVLKIDKKHLFTSIELAFKSTRPDFCIVVLPPHVHSTAYEIAAKNNVPILSEKPISDNYEDCQKTYQLIKAKKLKMAVIQNYRYEGPIMTLKKILDSGELGKIDYIVARYASDYRKAKSWDVGSVYDMKEPLLLEGSIHHLDMIRYLSNSNCKTVQGISWNPKWSTFTGNSSTLSLFLMENGVKAIYEGNSNEAGNINRWHQEYYRVECEKGSITVNRDKTVRIYTRDSNGLPTIRIPPILSAPPSGHHKILRDFIDWIDGGKEPETSLNDNIQSAMMVFAAIDSNEKSATINVQTFLPTTNKKI
ncbi:Gfo/Idh/MocA family oxidoreductase [Patescibacteria group bacterium]|nr:Gfo/Idh/MocA family oxidoreductase [Patescibacteria group bacterium]